MPGESIFLKVGANNLHELSCSERTRTKIAKVVLIKFYKLKGIEGPIEIETLALFAKELLEEIPSGNLVFPYAILNDWFERLKLNSVPMSVCV